MGILESLFVKISKGRYKKEIEEMIKFLDEEIKRLNAFKRKLIVPDNRAVIDGIISTIKFEKEWLEQERKDLFIGRLLGIID